MYKHNSKIQSREASLRRHRIEEEHKLQLQKVNPSKVYIKQPFNLKPEYSIQQKREIALRHKRLNGEAQLSKQKSKAQQLVEQEIVEPVEDTRNFEEKQEDFYLQQDIALKNCKRLIKDQREATTLYTYIRDAELINDFNTLFPRILRELNSSYSDISATFAFKEVQRILMSESDKSGALSTQTFKKTIDDLIHFLNAKLNNSNDRATTNQLQHALFKVEAIQQVRDVSFDTSLFDVSVGLDNENINEVFDSVISGDDPNETTLLKDISKEKLERAAMESNDYNVSSEKTDHYYFPYDNVEDNAAIEMFDIQQVIEGIDSISDDINAFTIGTEGHIKEMYRLYSGNERVKDSIVLKLSNISNLKQSAIKRELKNGTDAVIDIINTIKEGRQPDLTPMKTRSKKK